MKTGIILIALCGLMIGSCCSTATCGGGPELGFSVGFITSNAEYYYFDESEDVDLKVFYEDSVFVNVDKITAGEPDRRSITFIWDVDTSIDQYTILASDTLLGNLNLTYGTSQSQCCGSETSIVDFQFESEQKFSKEFGLQIIL